VDSEFSEEYFENGVKAGVSCYFQYKWLPDVTFPMVFSIIQHLKLTQTDRILDYGAAKGFTTKALRILGYDAWGCDCSEYAISKVEELLRPYVLLCSPSLLPEVENFPPFFDYVLSKDFAEHLTEDQLGIFLKATRIRTSKAFHIIPLGDKEGKFIVPEYQLDVTHKLAKSARWWIDTFVNYGWKTIKFDYAVRGIKDNWTNRYPRGNGFFLLE
jgi:hypothetical protein